MHTPRIGRRQFLQAAVDSVNVQVQVTKLIGDAAKKITPQELGQRFLEPGLFLHGVVTPDRAIFSLCVTESTDAPTLGRVILPGLDPHAVYEVRPVKPADVPAAAVVDTSIAGLGVPPWLQDGRPLRLSGLALGTVGIQTPLLPPDRCLLLEVTRSIRPETPASHALTHRPTET